MYKTYQCVSLFPTLCHNKECRVHNHAEILHIEWTCKKCNWFSNFRRGTLNIELPEFSRDAITRS
jgi:RNase P subunit RPR2